MNGLSCFLRPLAGALLAFPLACRSEPTPAPSEEPQAPSAPAKSSQPVAAAAKAATPPAEPDQVATEAGPITVVPLSHATLRIDFDGKHIYVDPWTKAPLPDSPKADLVLITDIHGDHLDPLGVDQVTGQGTVVVGPPAVAESLRGTRVMKNGEQMELAGVMVQAVPMYNNVRGPEAGKLFHDKGRGNGYVLTLGGKRVYISGDTECTEEMKELENIDVAFVCMNLPYTMPPQEAAECVNAFRPKIVYPYHFRGSDLSVFQKGITGEGIEVRIRDWYPESS